MESDISLIVPVLVNNGYKDVIMLIQTCKEILRKALNRDCLTTLINLYLDNGSACLNSQKRNAASSALPRFLYASIPSYLINMPYSVNININWNNCCLPHFLPEMLAGCAMLVDI